MLTLNKVEAIEGRGSSGMGIIKDKLFQVHAIDITKVKVCIALHPSGHLIIVFGRHDKDHSLILSHRLEEHFGDINKSVEFIEKSIVGGGFIYEIATDPVLSGFSRSLKGDIPKEIIPIVLEEFNKLRGKYLAEIDAEDQRGS